MLVLEGANGPVGALAGFRHQGTFHAYKTGWDPDWQRFGLGIELHARAIERVRAEGYTVYDFLSGRGDHKTALGGEEQPTASWIAPSGVAGLLLRGREQAARKRNAPQGDGSDGSSR